MQVRSDKCLLHKCLAYDPAPEVRQELQQLDRTLDGVRALTTEWAHCQVPLLQAHAVSDPRKPARQPALPEPERPRERGPETGSDRPSGARLRRINAGVFHRCCSGRSVAAAPPATAKVRGRSPPQLNGPGVSARSARTCEGPAQQCVVLYKPSFGSSRAVRGAGGSGCRSLVLGITPSCLSLLQRHWSQLRRSVRLTKIRPSQRWRLQQFRSLVRQAVEVCDSFSVPPPPHLGWVSSVRASAFADIFADQPRPLEASVTFGERMACRSVALALAGGCCGYSCTTGLSSVERRRVVVTPLRLHCLDESCSAVFSLPWRAHVCVSASVTSRLPLLRAVHLYHAVCGPFPMCDKLTSFGTPRGEAWASGMENPGGGLDAPSGLTSPPPLFFRHFGVGMPPPPCFFGGTHGDGLWGKVRHTACNVCLVAMWRGRRARSCGVLAAPCTYEDPVPLLAAPCRAEHRTDGLQ